MSAKFLDQANAPLRLSKDAPLRAPDAREVVVPVHACDVYRTDLHILDGELANPKSQHIPGHEIVGIVEAVGRDVSMLRIGDRVGVP